ncbi:SOS response-associated peptidase [Parachryseolinea silvisoli]|jgi:putative SOS response-associated peptidase YedK|uniref:SOS response-associated peptidase n=1 Tax=Parachryseolinea silvisoli TaxID=2873601 RepID=UPI002265C719|nr:SOS response-associated peptidase [Parachryseolinea silvisoli]MCD9018579.1 SOS response-associated peptidase [Parachryseolinea silvisoli]
MIDRYSITASASTLSDRFGVDVPEFYKPRYNATTTQLLPVITHTAPQGISNFYWGTSPAWAKNKTLSEKIINVRTETILEKAAQQKSIIKNRCIVPADSFYGWKRAGKKSFIPFRFVARDSGLFSFAGTWDEYEDTEGNQFHTFSVITVQANSLVASVQDRMPVILDPKEEAVWLNKESTEADLLGLLKPLEAEYLNHYSVSPRISDNAADVPSLIIPTPPADQFGNLTLFD